jgi:hypothetical protein
LAVALALTHKYREAHKKEKISRKGANDAKKDKKSKKNKKDKTKIKKQAQRLWTWDLLRASQALVRIARELGRGFQEPSSFLFPFDRKSALLLILSFFVLLLFSSLRRLRLCAQCGVVKGGQGRRERIKLNTSKLRGRRNKEAPS